MVGGPEEAFRRAEPLLRTLGSVIVHVGGHGAGQAAKLCNNLLAGVNMAAIAEACTIAERAGIDAQTLYTVLTSSTGDSRVLRTRFPLAGVESRHPVNADYEPLFMLDLLVKDLELARSFADELGLAPTLVEAALGAYREAQAAGLGRLDYSAVFLTTRPEHLG
jgi:3-hydroxyisobutyrate dehydrogenase